MPNRRFSPAPRTVAPSGPTTQSIRTPRFSLVSLHPDGSEAGTLELPAGTTIIGRDTGPFASDAYMSPRHAAFTPSGDRLHVRDQGSLNGVYRKLAPDHPFPLAPGQIFRIGQELIRFEALQQKAPDEHGVEYMGAPADGYVGRIVMVLGRESTGTAFPVPDTGLHLGRERGEVLFSDDGYVSGLHCRLSYEGGQVFLTDLGSSNGTFVRILDEVDLPAGEILLLGQQLFRISMSS